MSYQHPTSSKIEESKESIAKVVSDVSEGKPPASGDLVSMISDAQQVIEQQQQSGESLPRYGARIVQDVQDVLGDTQRFLQEKNKDDHLQKIITGVQRASDAQQGKMEQISTSSSSYSTASSMANMEGDLEMTGEYLRSVALQLVQSPEFRGVMLEFIQLLRSTFVLVSKEKHMNPVTHQLETDIKEQQHRPLSHSLKDTQQDLKDFAKTVVHEAKEGSLPVDPKQKDALYQQWDRLLRKFAHNRDFHHAAKGLLSVAQQLEHFLPPSSSVTSSMEQASSKVISDTARQEIAKVWSETGKFLAEFAGQENVESFQKTLTKLIRSIRDDPQLSKYTSKLRTFVWELLEAPQRLDDKDFRSRGEELVNEGRDLSSKWAKRRSLKQLTRKAEKLMNAIKNDPLSNKVAIDTKKLGEHLLLDEQGRPSLAVTQEAIQGLSTILLPVISEMLKSLPLPTIQGSNDSYDWALDKIILTSPQALLPENFVMFFRSKMNMKAPTPSTAPIQARLQASSISSQAEVVMRVQGFEIFLNDLHFYFKRKEFPKMEDSGVADISLTGAYNFFEVIWQLDQEQGLTLVDVRCVFDELEFNIKQAQHSILLPLITKLFKGTIKRRVEAFVEEYLTKSVVDLNTQLNQVISSAQRSTVSAVSSSVSSFVKQQQQSPSLFPSAVNPSINK